MADNVKVTEKRNNKTKQPRLNTSLDRKSTQVVYQIVPTPRGQPIRINVIKARSNHAVDYRKTMEVYKTAKQSKINITLPNTNQNLNKFRHNSTDITDFFSQLNSMISSGQKPGKSPSMQSNQQQKNILMAEKYYRSGLTAYDRGNLTETLAFLVLAVANNNLSKEYRKRLDAALNERQGIYSEVIELQSKLKKDENDHKARMRLARFLVVLNYSHEAQKHIDYLSKQTDKQLKKAANKLTAKLASFV